MIKCPYCNNRVRVIEFGTIVTLEKHGACRGSGAKMKGNWRDDVTYKPLNSKPAQVSSDGLE